MKVNYVPLAVVAKNIELLKIQFSENPVNFLTPLGLDASCIYALPALQLLSDAEFVEKHSTFTLEVLRYTLEKTEQNVHRQQLLSLVLDVMVGYGALGAVKYFPLRPQIFKLLVRHLHFEPGFASKGGEIDNRASILGLNHFLHNLNILYSDSLKNNTIELDKIEVDSLLAKLFSLDNTMLVYSVGSLDKFLFNQSPITCVANFIHCVLAFNSYGSKTLGAMELKEKILTSVTECNIPSSSSEHDWIDLKNYFYIKSKKNFLIQKDIFFLDVCTILEKYGKQLFHMSAARLEHYSMQRAHYSLAKTQERCDFIKTPRLRQGKLQYEALENFFNTFCQTSWSSSALRYRTGQGQVRDYIKKLRKTIHLFQNLSGASQMESVYLIDRSLISLLLSLAVEKNYTQAREVIMACKEELKLLILNGSRLIDYFYSSLDEFFSLVLDLLIKEEIVNPFNCNTLNFSDLVACNNTLKVLKKSQENLFFNYEKNFLEDSVAQMRAPLHSYKI